MRASGQCCAQRLLRLAELALFDLVDRHVTVPALGDRSREGEELARDEAVKVCDLGEVRVDVPVLEVLLASFFGVGEYGYTVISH